MSVVLLLGGVRSGKSRLAVQLAERAAAPVTVIATAEARDDEMASRIARHREERPRSWTTIEGPLDLSGALSTVPVDDVVVVDCVTMWVSNLMQQGDDDDAILKRAQQSAMLAAERAGLVIVVSNEVGSGVIPGTPVGRRFSELLGRVNALWADVAERSALVVAGKVLTLRDAGELLS
jgi:adenosyl cobinamide kinase/adenosyl cobinamide phosphate guanylyltransferase